MKIFGLILFGIITSNCCAAQAPMYFLTDSPANSTDLIKKNKIKKELTYSYTFIDDRWARHIIKDSSLSYISLYNEMGQLIVQEQIFKERKFSIKDSLVYNDAGQLVRKIHYTISLGILSARGFSEFTYDDAGNRVSFYDEEPLKDSMLKQYSQSTYNSKKQLITVHSKINIRPYPFQQTNAYNDAGELIREDYIDTNGTISASKLYEYDHVKNKTTVYSLRKKITHKDYVLEYNQSGQCVALINNLGAGSVDSFIYLNNGLFYEMKEIEFARIKRMERHFYFTQ